jgi:SHAQKYF class myb-like DNA-binding protein
LFWNVGSIAAVIAVWEMLVPGVAVEDRLASSAKRKRNVSSDYQPSLSSIRQLHQQNEELQQESKQKKRFIWPSALHEDFLKAVFEVGLNQATIQNLGDCSALSRVTPDVVDSHLQLLRLFVNHGPGSGLEDDGLFPFGRTFEEAASSIFADSGSSGSSNGNNRIAGKSATTPTPPGFSTSARSETPHAAPHPGYMPAEIAGMLKQVEFMRNNICLQYQQIEQAEHSLVNQISLYNNIIYNASRLNPEPYSGYHLPFEIYTKYIERQSPPSSAAAVSSFAAAAGPRGNLEGNVFVRGVSYPSSSQPSSSGRLAAPAAYANHYHHDNRHAYPDNAAHGGNVLANNSNVTPGVGSSNWPFEAGDEDSPTAFLSNASLMLEMQSHISLHKQLQKQRDDQLSLYGMLQDGSYEMINFDSIKPLPLATSGAAVAVVHVAGASKSVVQHPPALYENRYNQERATINHSHSSQHISRHDTGASATLNIRSSGSEGTSTGSHSSNSHSSGHRSSGSGGADHVVWDETDCDTSDLFSFLLPENNSSND